MPNFSVSLHPRARHLSRGEMRTRGQGKRDDGVTVQCKPQGYNGMRRHRQNDKKQLSV